MAIYGSHFVRFKNLQNQTALHTVNTWTRYWVKKRETEREKQRWRKREGETELEKQRERNREGERELESTVRALFYWDFKQIAICSKGSRGKGILLNRLPHCFRQSTVQNAHLFYRDSFNLSLGTRQQRRDNKAATTWTGFQATQVLVIALCLYLLRPLRLDTETLTF